ncbi:MAG: TIM-barrel domain-containing protein, partial [Promethearchaeota archaeon]
PSKLLANLAADGFRSVVIIDPGVKQEEGYPVYRDGLAYDYFLRKEDNALFVGTVWPGAVVLPDFLQPKVRRWWGNLHTTLIEQGVAAIWNDMNEPQLFLHQESEALLKVVHSDGRQTYPHTLIHNIYANMMSQSTFEALLRLRPNRRPWVLTRAGWAGVQRYAAVWTSDNSSRWDHLQVTIPMLLNLGMAGIPFVGADVGGFFNDCTPELFARWIQLAVFTPFCRNHTYKDTVDQEPWAFTAEVETISRHFIEWRYRLLPYLYDLFHDASITGTPIIRPLILEYPSDEHCYNIDDEFLLGASLLIAPVLTEGEEAREVYLPPGHWIDYYTKQQHTGPSTITVSAPLKHCPVFIRQGSIIPLQPIVQHSGQPVELLHLDVYPAIDGSFEYQHYEDDGETLGYQHGEMVTTQYCCHTEVDETRLEILPSEGPYNPGQRYYLITMATLDKSPTRILLNARQLTHIKGKSAFHTTETGWLWREDTQTLAVKFPDTRTRMELSVLH